jgi:hypothetical protein
MKTTTAITLFALLMVGCNSAKHGTSGNAPGPAGPAAVPQAATDAARDFLAKLVQGNTKAALEAVAVSFRKEVSGPLTFEDEKKLGYSNSDTEKYLREATAGANGSEIRSQTSSPSGNEVSIRGSLSGKETRLFSLRLAKEGDAWKVTRFLAGRVAGSGVPTDSGTPELAWARETALDFLDALIGGDDEQMITMNLMTESFKERLPAPSVADAGKKYAKKDVRDWLSMFRRGTKGYAINFQRMMESEPMFGGDLVGPGRSGPFQISLVKNGELWKVKDFGYSQ